MTVMAVYLDERARSKFALYAFVVARGCLVRVVRAPTAQDAERERWRWLELGA